MPPRVFISSTFVDLADHRSAVFGTLSALQARIHGMEFFGSRPGSPKTECLAEVRKCQIFVLILGMRYGSVDLESGLSFTHLEYLESRTLNLPGLCYLIDETEHLVLPKHVDIGEVGVKLKTLKEAVAQSHTVSFFRSPDDLKLKFAKDIEALIERERAAIESRELDQIVSTLKRADYLNEKRFTFLAKEIGSLGVGFKRPTVLKEVFEFLLVGDRHSAVYLTAKHTGLELRAAIDLCVKIETSLKNIVNKGLEILRKEKKGEPGATDNPGDAQ